jgi:hypothetical protein
MVSLSILVVGSLIIVSQSVTGKPFSLKESIKGLATAITGFAVITKTFFKPIAKKSSAN